MKRDSIDQIDELILKLDTSLPKGLEQKLSLVPVLAVEPERPLSLWGMTPFIFLLVTTAIMIIENFGFISGKTNSILEIIAAHITSDMVMWYTVGFAGSIAIGALLFIFHELYDDHFMQTN